MYKSTFILSILFMLLCVSTATAKRIALVIGNSAYENVPSLTNPRNDAEDMSKTFTELGFEVSMHLDLKRFEMERVLDGFASKLENARMAVFFYAGHALQVGGKNYILPVDSPILTKDELLKLQRLHIGNFQRLMERKVETNILLLDACRDNPFGRGLVARSGSRSTVFGQGLGVIEAGSGTLISYATAPGATAADGVGRNSPYTASLKTRLKTKNRDLALILREVRKDVQAATNDRQIPWTAESLTGSVILSKTLTVDKGQAVSNETNKQPVSVLANEATKLSEIQKFDLACGESSVEIEGVTCVHPGRGVVIRDRQKNGKACTACPSLVAVPVGNFVPAGANGFDRRKYRRQVKKPFLMSVNEVTFAQWDACVSAGGCGGYHPEDNGWGRGDRPVINVSAEDGEAYADWLSRLTNQAYALPTEAEWSYAARAGTKTSWWWGDQAKPDFAHFGQSSGSKVLSRRTRSVTSFPPNPWGIKNVHGNVAEWTASCWSKQVDLSLTKKETAERSLVKKCSRRVVRGGGWNSSVRSSRSNARQSVRVKTRRDTIGFRVMRLVEPSN